MVSFNNSIMIRNHAGDPVKSTARLIETLKKVGIIKTKKRRAKRSLATSDEIRQENDMGPGFITPTPMGPQFGGSPQQQDFNAQRIEDVQRQAGNQIALLRGRIQQLESAPPTRLQPQQRIEQGPQIEQMASAERPIIAESEEFKGAQSGPQPDQGSARMGMGIDYDTTPTSVFIGDEQAQAQAGPLTDDQKIAIAINNFKLKPLPKKTAKKDELVAYIDYLASPDGLDQIAIASPRGKQTKDQVMSAIRSILLDTYNGLPY